MLIQISDLTKRLGVSLINPDAFGIDTLLILVDRLVDYIKSGSVQKGQGLGASPDPVFVRTIGAILTKGAKCMGISSL